MSDKLGTAQWEEPKSVEKKIPYKEGTFWLGRSITDKRKPLGYGDDRHICLVSGSRGGKGTSFIIPNLCLWPGSVVVVDPKGENATVTAARRGQGSEHCDGMGQAVHVLDPFKAAEVSEDLRSRFNPLDTLDPNNPETIDEASRIADALVVKTEDSKDRFWDESARSMIKGLILHILTAPEYEGQRNLITLRKLILRGDWDAIERLKSYGEKDLPTGQEMLWEGLSQNPAFGGLVAGIGERFRDMAITAEKQFQSILQIADVNTEFIDSPGMQDCLSTSDFSLSELKTSKKGVSLYLSLPQRYMETHFRWLRMMIGLTIDEMQIVKGNPAGGYPILMCLDEFAGLQRMKSIENAIAQIAGYGVKLFFVLQSLEQLKSTYKDNWETFLSNSSLKIFASLGDHIASREYISKSIGETEIIRKAEGASESEGTNKSTAIGKSQQLTKGTQINKTDTKSTGKNSGDTKNNADNVKSSNKTQNNSKGKTINKGKNEAITEGTSQTDTEGEQQSSTKSTTEQILKRPLITPDEIDKKYARIDDKKNPNYPGLVLVIIQGQNPFNIKKINYYEDIDFNRLHDPHPNHDPPKLVDAPVYLPGTDSLKFLSALSVKKEHIPSSDWLIKKGDFIQAGSPIIRYFSLADTGNYNAHVREGRPNNELLMVAPVSGFIKNMNPNPEGKEPALIIATYEKWYTEQLDYDVYPEGLGFRKDNKNDYGNGWYLAQYKTDIKHRIKDEIERKEKSMFFKGLKYYSIWTPFSAILVFLSIFDSPANFSQKAFVIVIPCIVALIAYGIRKLAFQSYEQKIRKITIY